MVGGVMAFAERPVREVMTPRTDIVAVDGGRALEEIRAGLRAERVQPDPGVSRNPGRNRRHAARLRSLQAASRAIRCRSARCGDAREPDLRRSAARHAAGAAPPRGRARRVRRHRSASSRWRTCWRSWWARSSTNMTRRSAPAIALPARPCSRPTAALPLEAIEERFGRDVAPRPLHAPSAACWSSWPAGFPAPASASSCADWRSTWSRPRPRGSSGCSSAPVPPAVRRWRRPGMSASPTIASSGWWTASATGRLACSSAGPHDFEPADLADVLAALDEDERAGRGAGASRRALQPGAGRDAGRGARRARRSRR